MLANDSDKLSHALYHIRAFGHDRQAEGHRLGLGPCIRKGPIPLLCPLAFIPGLVVQLLGKRFKDSGPNGGVPRICRSVVYRAL